jgi:hypothetical protein
VGKPAAPQSRLRLVAVTRDDLLLRLWLLSPSYLTGEGTTSKAVMDEGERTVAVAVVVNKQRWRWR